LPGFDAFCASHTPTEGVFAVLGSQLDTVADACAQSGGEIDKTIGDKVLVVLDHDRMGGAKAAALAALAIVARLRAHFAADGTAPSLEPVFGINCGTVLAGILGARSVRLDYTVIGDAVNLAARLATLAHTIDGSHVVLSAAVLANLPRHAVRAEKLPFKRVKGKTQEVEAWLLVDDGASG